MVIMIKDTALPSRAGSMAKRCSATPPRWSLPQQRTRQAGSGMPVSARKTVDMPPSITNSPWAKLMTSEAL